MKGTVHARGALKSFWSPPYILCITPYKRSMPPLRQPYVLMEQPLSTI